MVRLTIDVPEELASRLQPVRNRLVDIIELGLAKIEPVNNPLHNELIEFLASGPSAQEILAFRPSNGVTERVSTLLDKKSDSSLTADEQMELDQNELLDYLMTLVKARARQRLMRVQ